jgi:single-stranded-DNA-specific exonuclease
LEHGAIWQGIDEDITLAAIGAIGDLVPLTGENRILVMHALRLLKKLPTSSALRHFFDQVRSQGRELTSTDIAFRVVPRINAGGRMADPRVAFDALLGDSKALDQLHTLNTARRDLVEELIEQAQALVRASDLFLFACSENFPAGVAGLLASSLSQQFGRPSLVGSIRADGSCTASLRSVPQVNIIEILHHPSVRPLLSNCGGHAQAAGCTFEFSNIDAIRRALNAAMAEQGMSPEDLIPTLHADGEIQSGHVTVGIGKQLQSLEPFGQGNDQPLFLLRSQAIDNLRAVGSDSRHLQCRIEGTKAIGFGLAKLLQTIDSSHGCDVLCSIGINEWNGREEVQLVIRDIRKSE